MFKVAIIGPESTGKTELASGLALHFAADWVPEYARTYVENLTVPYTFQDICNIAQKQIADEKRYDNMSGEGYVFFDTDLIITKVWFEYCYKTVPDFVTERLQSTPYDLYLLCCTDLPWQPDKVREHGSDREFFFDWYKKEIEKTGIPYIMITGKGEQRLQNAVEAVQRFVNLK